MVKKDEIDYEVFPEDASDRVKTSKADSKRKKERHQMGIIIAQERERGFRELPVEKLPIFFYSSVDLSSVTF